MQRRRDEFPCNPKTRGPFGVNAKCHLGLSPHVKFEGGTFPQGRAGPANKNSSHRLQWYPKIRLSEEGVQRHVITSGKKITSAQIHLGEGGIVDPQDTVGKGGH